MLLITNLLCIYLIVIFGLLLSLIISLTINKIELIKKEIVINLFKSFL